MKFLDKEADFFSGIAVSLETNLSCVFVSFFKDIDSRDAKKAGLILMVASKRCPGPEGESLSNIYTCLI